jgi:hypothetical protein
VSPSSGRPSIPARILRALPRPPWTEHRALTFDNSDLAGLSRAQIWGEKHEAEEALYYLLKRCRDGTVWPPYLGSPYSATAWLEQRIAACGAAMRAAMRDES